MKLSISSDKVSILHLSDIHFKVGNNPIDSRVESIVRVLKAVKDVQKEIIILWSGDIAQSGNGAEYSKAELFFTDLATKLIDEGHNIIGNIAVPGNHDVLMGDDSRIDAADKINVGEMSNSRVEACLKAQDSYFSFVRTALDFDISDQERLYKFIELDSPNGSAIFHCFNTSWLSRLGGELGKLIIPVEQLNLNESSYNISLTIMHHPISWLNPYVNRNETKLKIDEISDIVITGHEHASYNYNAISQAKETIYIESGALQQWESPKNSAFHIINLDISKGNVTVNLCDFSRGFYHSSRVMDFKVKERNPSKGYDFNFKKSFTDDLLPIPPNLGNLPIPINGETLYETPDLILRHKEDKKSSIVSADKVIESLSAGSFVILTGDSRSGKTALMYEYMKRSIRMGIIPIYVNAPEYTRDIERKRYESILKNSIENQYSNGTKEIIDQLGYSEKLLIIDGSDLVNSSDLGEMIESMKEDFKQIIIMSSGDYSLISEEYSKDFIIFEIAPMGRRQRRRMLDRLSYYYQYGINEEFKIDRAEEELNKVLKYNNLPAWPINVILISNSLFAGNFSVGDNATYGHLYEILIDTNIAKYYRNLNEFSTIKRILGVIAFNIHKSSVSFNETSISKVCLDYNENFDTSLDPKHFIDIMYSASIFRQINGHIEFSYPAYFHYFVAHYINSMEDSLFRQEVDDLIIDIKTVYKSEILLFLAYLSDQDYIITNLISRLSSIFDDVDELDMKKDFEKLDEFIKKIPNLVYQNSDYRENKDELREHQDEAEEDARVSWRSYSDKREDFQNDYSISFKIIEIIGQIMRNKSGTISASLKTQAIMASFSAILRAGREINDMVVFYIEDVLPKAVIAAVSRGIFPISQQSEMIDRSRMMLVFMNEAIMFSFIRTSTSSFAFENLRKTIKRMDGSEIDSSKQMFMVSLILKMSDISYPFDKIKTVYEEYGDNPLAKNIIQYMVMDHILYNRMTTPDIQRALKDVNITYNPKIHSKILD